jgi:hypothetical protein
MWHQLLMKKIQRFRKYCIQPNKINATQKTALSSYVSDEFKQSNIFPNSKLRITSFCSALLRAPIANFSSDKSCVLFDSSVKRLDTVLSNRSKLLAIFLLHAIVTTDYCSWEWPTGGHDYRTTPQSVLLRGTCKTHAPARPIPISCFTYFHSYWLL